MKKFDSKMGNVSMVMTDKVETKAIRMKSAYIMAEETHNALKRDANITEAKTLDYEKVQKYIKDNRNGIFKNATKFKINVLTDEGWRSGQFFGKNDNPDWYDPAKHYDDNRGEIDEIYMIQILFL